MKEAKRIATLPINWESRIDDPLMKVSPADAITYRHLFEGVGIYGATGSGKTSGPGERIAELLLRNGAGIVVLCAKSDEKDTWIRRAKAAGRENDLCIFGVGQPWRLNILNYAYEQSARGTKDAQNVVQLLNTILEIKDRSTGAQGEQRFWQSMASQLLNVAILILGSAGEPLSFENIDRVLRTAPLSFDQLLSDEWKAGYLNQLIDRIAARGDKLNDIERNDATVAVSYFLEMYVSLDDRTRAGIIASVESILWPFRSGPLSALCNGTTNLRPEDAFDGKIIVLDLPLKLYHETGLLLQASIKLLSQRAFEARDVRLHPRPVALYIDECQLFLTSYDAVFLATARSARCVSVLLTQNVDSIRARFPGPAGKAEAESLLGQLSNKIFCCNDHVATNRWAADLCGEEHQLRASSSASLGREHDNFGTTLAEQRRHLLPPLTFARLKRGGPEQGNAVETIFFRSGRTFAATKTNFIKTIFPQS